MSDQDAFKERLKRLEKKHGGFKQPPSFDFDTPEPKPKRDSAGFGIKQLMIGFIAMVAIVVVGSGVMVAKTVTSENTRTYAGVHKEATKHMDHTTADTFSRLATGKTPRSINGLFLESAFRAQAGNGPQPAAFYPTAKGQWMGVYADEAMQPDALQVMNDRWTTQTRAPLSALQNHKASKKYQWFMKLHKEPSLQRRATAPVQNYAFYIHPSGQFLDVRVRFLHKQTILGEPRLGSNAEKAMWIDQLEKLEQKERSSSATFERVRLAGIPSMNRMENRNGVSIRSSGRSANVVDVAVPLSSHAVLYMRGVATVRDLEQLIRSVDRKTLMAMHDGANKS